MPYAQSFALVAGLMLADSVRVRADDTLPLAKFLQSWAAAWQSSDVDKMMDFYESSKDTIAIESLGHVRKGPTEIRKMYQGAFDELTFDRVSLTPVAQGQHESVAWATCRYKAEIRLRSDNTRFVMEVMGTFIARREGSTWKITAEHFSTLPDTPRVRRAAE
jgi:ketosteroid isomerase-like protein